MKYLISKFEFKNDKNGNEYIQIELMNEDDPFACGQNPPVECIFGERMVGLYKRALQAVNNDFKQLPDAYKYFAGAKWVIVDLPTPMHRIYTSQFTDGKGVVHQPGEIITDKSGKPRIYTSIRVLCKEFVDNETGERDWAVDWDPVARANRYISSFFIAADMSNEPAQVSQPLPQGAPAPDPLAQPTQQTQQTASQQTQQVVQPIL